MSVLSALEPKSVFSYFETICSIPHPSGQEGLLADYIVRFAQERGLEHYRDELHNVVVIKEATAGYEQEEPIILQGHLDMVCEQSSDRNIDFSSEGLDLYIEDGCIAARGTTLGGDDGIAVAYALALLDAEDIPHPRLEVVLTVSEEVGMEGAAAIDLSMLRGHKVLNLDSEEEGQIMASCAGGCRVDCQLPVERTELEGQLCVITVSGLTGGHSGAEIHKRRGNASRVLTRLLVELGRQISFSLVSLEGGSKDNAIPREAKAQIVLSSKLLPALSAALPRCRDIAAAPYLETDPNLEVKLTPMGHGLHKVMSSHSGQLVLTTIQFLPDGVQAMSQDIEGLVETSLNLGVMSTRDSYVQLRFSVRSSKLAAKDELKHHLYKTVTALGGKVFFAGDYPPWEFRKDSPLRDDICALYERLYQEKARVVAIHAGLECGMLSEKIADMDAVSIGPNMHDIHTTEERLEIDSVRRTWELLLEILALKH
ncbi:MAG: aminoacyl-histidine dipeptidase [Oscillospiraceae bacterium]|nr:aminoacyl-histidine dipeptidase [Oscillospiraceae bacterium]